MISIALVNLGKQKRLTQLLFFFLLFAMIISNVSSSTESLYNAKAGYIDLSQWDFEKNGLIKLSGQWKFKWLQDKDEFKFAEYDDSDWDNIEVPGYWNSKLSTGEGFGWLRMKIKNQADTNLSIYLAGCYTAYTLYVNGTLYLKNGEANNDRRTSKAQNLPVYCELPKDEYLTLAWKITNFHDHSGGPLFSPVINITKKLKHELWLSDFKNIAIMGMILMISMYNLIIWIGRKKDLPSLFLSLFCLSIFVRLFTIDCYLEKIFYEFYIFDIRKVLEYLSISIGCFSFISYIDKLFPDDINNIVIKISQSICIGLSLFFVFTPPFIFTKFLQVYQLILLLASVYSIIIISLAIKNKRSGSILILWGVIFLVITILNDILYANEIIKTTNLISIGLLIFIMMQSIILSKRFADAYHTANHLSKNLDIEVKKRTKELEEAKKEIEEQSKQKTALFINLAHETKTPLTLINNSLNKFTKNYGELKEALILKQNIEKLKNDMVNFLDTEKFRRNEVIYDHDRIFCLSDFVVNKSRLFKDTAEKKEIDLSWNITDNIFIKAAPLAIDRILNNLLDNAVKYTEKNGSIHVDLKREGGKIVIKVSDTGIGIPEEYKDKIFSPFYQIFHKKKNIQGLGMGLNITKQIVEGLGGSISLNSVPSKGTDFVVTLKEYEKQPCDIVDSEFELPKMVKNIITETDLKTPKHDGSKNTIFIVEDNLQMIAGLIDYYQENFNLYFSVNGREALEKLKIIPGPDVIISDIMMDEMDGYEFRDRLSKTEEYRAIPFIFLTAKTGEDEKLKGLAQGAVDFISKPFNMEQLEEKIKTWIMLVKLNKNRKNISDIHKKKFDAFIEKYDFSKREIEILGYLLDGKTNREMVDKMGVSDSTVRSHLGRIKIKMKISKKTDLIDHLFNHVYQ